MGKQKHDKISRKLHFMTQKMDSAIYKWNLIDDGDRILIGASGGKDSFALACLLNWRMKFAKEKYNITAAHVIGDARGVWRDLPSDFTRWFADMGIDLITRPLDRSDAPLDCARCSYLRRKALFEIAEQTGCNKIALAHTMDDIAQTALMNLFSQGSLYSMPPLRKYFNGRFTVIRPLCLTLEKETAALSKLCGFPVIKNDCPAARVSKRSFVRDIIFQAEKNFKAATAAVAKAALDEYDSGGAR